MPTSQHERQASIDAPADAPAVAAAAAPAAAPARLAPPRHLPEVQGLRTIALILVATFHIWLGKVSGGVDIFLLISAYLLTRSLVARAEAGEATRPVTFILRKFARLMPAAVLTVVLTVLAGLALLSPLMWRDMIEQAWASVTYTMNLWLQSASVDYYHQNRTDANLFQHFWSLAIQGQVFVVWPLVHVAGERIARRFGWPVRRVLLVAFGAITVASFAHALALVADDPAFAYFDGPARAWEFGVGSCLALAAPRLRLPAAWRRPLIWAGVLGAVSCGFVLPEQPGFPGLPSLWPVVSAALVIVASDAPHEAGWRGDPIIGHRVLQVAGRYTYALYLVHWPILMLAKRLLVVEQVSAGLGLTILAGSAVAAIGVTWLADRPAAALIRRDRPSAEAGWAPRVGWRVPAVLIASALVGAISLAGSMRWFDTERDRELEAVAAAVPSQLGPQGSNATGPLVPGPLLATEQLREVPPERCADDDPFTSDMCYTTGDDGERARSLLVIGNSHAVAYTGLIRETAEQRDWSLRVQVASACSFLNMLDEPEAPSPDDACATTWWQATRYILDRAPDAVFVVGTLSVPNADDWRFESGGSDLRDWSERIRARTGTQVIAIRDTPRFDRSPLECATQWGFEAPECLQTAQPYSTALVRTRDDLRAAGAIWVDLTTAICPGLECRPSLGGVVTYFDNGHITDLFSRTLAQAFADQVSPHLDWWPSSVWTSERDGAEAGSGTATATPTATPSASATTPAAPATAPAAPVEPPAGDDVAPDPGDQAE